MTIISPAQEKDAAALEALVLGNAFSAHWTRSDFEAELKNPAALVLKLEEPDAPATPRTLAAFIAYRFIAPQAELNNFAVGNAYLRRGFGALLLKESLAVLKSKGVSEVTLEVNENNAAALALYAKFGFKQVSVRKKFYNNLDDALLLKLFL